jgi:hypothetical protein
MRACMHACMRMLVLVYMNGDGSNKQVLIILGKLLHPRCLKSIKIFPRYTVPLKRHGMTMTISWSFCGHWIITVQGGDIFLFVDGCAAHSHVTSSLRSIKVVYCPLNCTTTLCCCNVDTIKCFKLLYRKHLVQNIYVWWTQGMMLNWISCFASIAFQCSSLMTSCAVRNC